MPHTEPVPEYVIESTSNVSANVRDIEIGRSPNGQTRKILRAEIVENARDAENVVKVTIVHQRQSTSVGWQDIDGRLLSSLHAGETAKMSMNTDETRALLTHLNNLYGLGARGIRAGVHVLTIADEDMVIATDAGKSRLLRKIAESENLEELVRIDGELGSSVSEMFAISKLHKTREDILRRFVQMLNEEHSENEWKAFLKEHSWIFGVSNIEVIDESRLGIHHDTDIPFGTEGGFIDIAELKLPGEKFWKQASNGATYLYRSKYPVPEFIVSAAVEQVTGYIFEAEKNVNNTDFIRDHGGRVPLKPRGLVVVGRSNNWTEVEWTAYRLLNDRLHGVQVITYDILLERANRALKMLIS